MKNRKCTRLKKRAPTWKLNSGTLWWFDVRGATPASGWCGSCLAQTITTLNANCKVDFWLASVAACYGFACGFINKMMRCDIELIKLKILNYKRAVSTFVPFKLWRMQSPLWSMLQIFGHIPRLNHLTIELQNSNVHISLYTYAHSHVRFHFIIKFVQAMERYTVLQYKWICF